MGGVFRKIGADPLGLTKRGGPLGKPEIPKPTLPPPVAIPEKDTEAEDWAYRQAKRGRGYTSTIITGAVAPKATDKKLTWG